MSEIKNRVASSPIVTIDLESFYERGDRILFDLEPLLFQGIVVKEKEFRQQVKEMDLSDYSDKMVGIHCSVDAIIPTWAFMLVAVRLQEAAREVVIGDLKALEIHLIGKALRQLDLEALRDKPVVVKGCSKLPVPDYAYGELVRLVLPVVKSLMFGEACSTVPVYKRPKVQGD